jgi:hypothetical protein
VICLTAHLVRHKSSTAPGGIITYSIWVWTTARATQVSARAVTTAHAMTRPRYTLCPVKRRTTCKIGTLPANQAIELIVTDRVRTTAKSGAPINFTITASDASMSPASATIETSVSKSGHSPVTGGTIPSLPPVTYAPIPGATVSPSGLSGLFPTVTPSAQAANSGGRHNRLAGVTQTSSALPLDPRLIGGQLAGLAVLAAAITMVVARLSLRTPQASTPGPAAAAGSPDGEEPESAQPGS